MGTNARTPEAVSRAVSEELRVIRARLPKESVRDLADRCEVPYSTLHKTLAGERMVDVEELHKIARALGSSGSSVMAAVEEKLRAGGANVTRLPKKPAPGVQKRAARKDTHKGRPGT